MAEECTNNKLLIRHSEQLAALETNVAHLQLEINNVGKIHELMYNMSEVQGKILSEMQQSRSVNKAIQDDIKYLKENAETKATVNEIEERVDVLERSDGESAKHTLDAIRSQITKVIIAIVLALLLFSIGMIYMFITRPDIVEENNHGTKQIQIESSMDGTTNQYRHNSSIVFDTRRS